MSHAAQLPAVPAPTLRRCWEIKQTWRTTASEAASMLRREGHPDPPGMTWERSGVVTACAAAWDRHLNREKAIESRRQAIRRIEDSAAHEGPQRHQDLRDLHAEIERIEDLDAQEIASETTSP